MTYLEVESVRWLALTRRGTATIVGVLEIKSHL